MSRPLIQWLLPALLMAGFGASTCLADSSVRETALVRAVQQCRRSVVNIHTERMETGGEENSRFFPQKPRKVTGMGTGIVVDERGYIVTNFHVVQDVDLISVTLHDGSVHIAQPVSFDRRHDLAVVRVEADTPLTVMPIGTSSDLMLAETVFAVGNAFGYEHTVTSGIVSAISRDVEVDETQSYENLIQTDASINPGNSGGPLLNLDGEVIGINVAIHGKAQRIGFAIPIDDARRTIARLLSVERLEGRTHGLMTTDLKAPGRHELRVDEVRPGSAAARCGIREGDVIRSVRGFAIHDGTDLERALLGLQDDKPVEVVVRRDGTERTLQYAFIGRATRSSDNPAERTDQMPVLAASAEKPATAAAGTRVESPASAEGDDDPILQQASRLLGLTLARTGGDDAKLIRRPYKGGMRVQDVRANSPAARFGIRPGDVLVGLDGFETLSTSSLRYILRPARLRNLTTMSFQILRAGSPPLQGTMDLRPPHS